MSYKLMSYINIKLMSIAVWPKLAHKKTAKIH